MKIKLKQKFYDTFTKNELNTIFHLSFLIGDDCIVINTKQYFFELSINKADKLIIYYSSNDNLSDDGILTKEKFLELLQTSSKEKIKYLQIDI